MSLPLSAMDRWKDKTALVTGAGSGIGAGVAAALAAAGMRVIALDRNEEEHIMEALSKLNCESSVTARQCDVTDTCKLTETYRWLDRHYGGVHVLICSAGVLFPGQITDVGSNTLSENQLDDTVEVNFKGLVLCAKFAIASMHRRGFDGHIININSLAGHYVPFNSEMNIYSASKKAVSVFHEEISKELALFDSKIKVTSISPGKVNSKMASTMLDALGEDSKGPMLRPRDIAHAVLYALSTPAHFHVNEVTITSVPEIRL